MKCNFELVILFQLCAMVFSLWGLPLVPLHHNYAKINSFSNPTFTIIAQRTIMIKELLLLVGLDWNITGKYIRLTFTVILEWKPCVSSILKYLSQKFGCLKIHLRLNSLKRS